MNIYTREDFERQLRDTSKEVLRSIERRALHLKAALTGGERFPRHMNFTGPVQVTHGQTMDWETTQRLPLGTQGITRDGRKFRYVLNGAVALVSGNVIQGPAIVTTHLAMTPVAAAIGATSVTAALGATLATANQYAGGYMSVDTTPGNGRAYSIAGHPAAALSTSLTVQLDISDPITVALTTASRVGFVANVHAGTIVAPQTTATGKIVGVAASDIAIANYGWVQTYGVCSVLINGTPALGAALLGISGTTAGAVDIATAAPWIVSQGIGVMLQIGVSGKNNAAFLMID